jgi:hypothetical protein
LALVLMLSGPIGAGKTTVAQELVALWPRPFAAIEGDKVWPFLVKREEGDPREDFRILMLDKAKASVRQPIGNAPSTNFHPHNIPRADQRFDPPLTWAAPLLTLSRRAAHDLHAFQRPRGGSSYGDELENDCEDFVVGCDCDGCGRVAGDRGRGTILFTRYHLALHARGGENAGHHLHDVR